MLALHDGLVLADGPAFESLQGRKTAGRLAAADIASATGIWPGGRAAGRDRRDGWDPLRGG